MQVTSRSFVVVATLSGLVLGMADLVETALRMSPVIGDHGAVVIDPAVLLADGSALAGLSIACAVLVAHLLTTPGWWRWVSALGAVTLAVEAPSGFQSFTALSSFIQHPDLTMVPLPLAAIWLPGTLLTALARPDRSPDDAPTEPAAHDRGAAGAVGTALVTGVVAASVALLLALAVATALGGVQLLFGVESDWFLFGSLPDVVVTAVVTAVVATVITAVVTAWVTAGAVSANAAWLLASVLLASLTVLVHLGPDALLFPVLVVGALGLARGHRNVAARARRLVEA